MSDRLIVHLIGEHTFATGARRAAAMALLKYVKRGVELAHDLEGVLAGIAQELGDEVADHARDICRKMGMCE